MALYSIDPFYQITHIPHRRKFDAWCSGLKAEQLYSIRSELRKMIEADNERIHTSSWMPGNNWENTVWQPIYTDACDFDEVNAGLCFGLFVWEAFLEHPEAWSFGRYEIDGREIRGLTYFRIHLSR